MKEAKHFVAVLRAQWLVTADQLVVSHATISKYHSAPGLHPDPTAARKARPEYHCIQQIAFKAYVLWHRAVVERTGEWGDEVDVSAGPAFQKAATRDLDQDLELRELMGSRVAR